jgi:endogenous inhibitor of DNA gyrase (YacG/DUF329 family)
MLRDTLLFYWRTLRGRCIECGGKINYEKEYPLKDQVCRRCFNIDFSEFFGEEKIGRRRKK